MVRARLPDAEPERRRAGERAILCIGEEYGWLVDALAGVARAGGWPEARSRALGVLADRLALGVKPDALPLARLRARGVGRTLLRRLVDAGIGDPDALRAAGREGVGTVLKNKSATASIWVAATRGTNEPLSPAPIESIASRAADAETPAQQPAGPELVVDLRSRRVTYRGHSIPTKPPHNLRRGSLLALAVLASRPGDVISMPDLAAAMRKLARGGLRIVTPEPRDVRYQLITPFRVALKGLVEDAEIESLIQNVPGVGLCLQIPGGADVIGPTARQRKAKSRRQVEISGFEA